MHTGTHIHTHTHTQPLNTQKHSPQGFCLKTKKIFRSINPVSVYGLLLIWLGLGDSPSWFHLNDVSEKFELLTAENTQIIVLFDKNIYTLCK